MVQQPIVLLAASGLAREVVAVVEAAGTRQIVGVLDDDQALRGTELGGIPVVGGIGSATQITDAEFVVCAGNGSARATIVGRLIESGIGADRFATIVHPSASIPSSCRIGRGSIVLSNVTLTADVTVGEHVVLMPQVVLTHDNRVGDFATLCAGVVLGGNVSVGSAAYLGMNASVRQGVRLGIGATLGMGSVLLRDVPDGQVWAGVPAAQLGVRIENQESGERRQQSGRSSTGGSMERLSVS